MKLNKILCLALALTIALSALIMPAIAVENEKLTDIELLYELGIVKGYEDGELHPEYNITRMEYAALIIRCLGYSGEFSSLETVFSDVPKDSWGAAAVQFAYELGIIDGYGDGRFGPDDNILEVDAVKIIVSALGRGLEAEAEGGYPTGYLSIGKRLGVMEKLSGTDAKATRGYVAELLANALDISIVERNYNNNVFTETKGRTFLSILGLSRYKGVLTGICGMSIGTDENIATDEVVISGRRFKTDKVFSPEFVGEQVNAYIYKYGESEEKLVALFGSAQESENIVVEAKDISDKTTLRKFVYTDDNEEEEVELPPALKISYNGTLLSKSNQITPERLKPVNGYVKLIDTNKDDVYETALVKEYTTRVVRSVADDSIYDIYRNNIEFEIKDENSYIVVTKDGKKAAWEDIKAGDVLSIASNMEKNVAEIIICDKMISSTVKSYAVRDGRKHYGLDDGERCTTLEYEEALAGGYREALELEIGNTYTLKLNSFGEIAQVSLYVPGEDEEEIFVRSGEEKYGFLVEAASKQNAMSDDVEIRVLTMNNRLEIFTLDSDKGVRFGRVEGSYKTTKVAPTAVLEKISDGTRITRQIIKYVLDENNIVRELYLADSKSGSAELSIDGATGNYFYAYDTVNQKYYYDENTAVFLLPSLGIHNYDIRAVKPSEYINERTSYNSELWDIDSDGYINCICIFPATAATWAQSNREYVLNFINDPVMLVTDIGEVASENGLTYKIIEGYEAGKKVRRLMSDKLSSISDIKPGMIIQYGMNSSDLQYAMYAEDDEVVLGYSILFDCNERDTDPFMLFDYKQLGNNNPRIQFGYGTVTRYDYPVITHGTDGYVSTINSETMVLKYNRNGSIEKIDPLDITEGSKVFIRKRLHSLREIIVIE